MADIPGDFSPISLPSVQFNNPVSEASLTSIGASVNGLLGILLPVGSLLHSMLSEAQLHGQQPTDPPFTWVLADGRDVTGSAYQTVTGHTTVPDMRGTYLRGKDNGRGIDSHGDPATGTFEADQFGNHNHAFSDPGHEHATTYQGTGLTPQLRNSAYASGSSVSGTDATGSNAVMAVLNTTGINISTQGGGETNPKSVVVNIFIRIN